MNYGKNQLALLKFLEKYPNRWHRVTRPKAIRSAKLLYEREELNSIGYTFIENQFHVGIFLPQMLIKQN